MLTSAISVLKCLSILAMIISSLSLHSKLNTAPGGFKLNHLWLSQRRGWSIQKKKKKSKAGRKLQVHELPKSSNITREIEINITWCFFRKIHYKRECMQPQHLSMFRVICKIKKQPISVIRSKFKLIFSINTVENQSLHIFEVTQDWKTLTEDFIKATP